MEHFDAATFLAQLEAGAFDGNLTQAIRRLTYEQLQQIGGLLADRDSPRTQSLET
jgi:hypothetical protein